MAPAVITHIIYHIPGRKVGCTKDFVRRKMMYKERDGFLPEFEILEELQDKTDQEAGDIEWAWADRLGYPRGIHYVNGLIAIGRMGQAGGRIGGKIGGPIGGRNRAAALTPERRSEISGIAGRRSSELGLSGFKVIPVESRAEVARSGGTSKRGVCPHCGAENNLPNLVQWHFDKCRQLRHYGFVRRT